MEEEKESKSIPQLLEDLNKKFDSLKEKKEKKFKLPFLVRVGKKKLREGYLTVEFINENKEVSFKKLPIIDGTIRSSDGNIYAVEEMDIFTYKGKPFVHQPKTKINPWNPLSDYIKAKREVKVEDGEGNEKTHTLNSNEVYGQKYVMARMKSDFIKSAKKIGWGVSIFGLVVAGIIAYSFLSGGA